MTKTTMGAFVKYCGHEGGFVADLIVVAGACIVRANGPISGDNIIRRKNAVYTHHLMDFPTAGFWRPDLGVFVVPVEQCRKLTNSKRSGK